MDPAETEREVVAAIDEAIHRAKMAPLLIVMALLITLGLASVAASVVNVRQTQAASKADVRRNLDLIQQVKDLQAANANRSALRYAALCGQLNLIARELGAPVGECETR